MIETVQVAPAASEVPQVLVWAKRVGLAPVNVIPVIASGPVPGFESVAVMAVAVTPT